MKRGFTLVELMVVVALLPIVMAAVGHLYLEGRIAATQLEARLAIHRGLSLAHEWIARDLRGASSVEFENDLKLGEISYSVGSGGLVREAPDRTMVLERRVVTLEVQPRPGGFHVLLRAKRKLAPGRVLRLTRASFVAKRR